MNLRRIRSGARGNLGKTPKCRRSGSALFGTGGFEAWTGMVGRATTERGSFPEAYVVVTSHRKGGGTPSGPVRLQSVRGAHAILGLSPRNVREVAGPIGQCL